MNLNFISIIIRFVKMRIHNRVVINFFTECKLNILLSTTNKMQRYTVFFTIVSALRVLGNFSTHHQELKNCTHSIWYMPGLLASCWLYLKEYINNARSHERQM